MSETRSFGALPVSGGTQFRLWASSARTATLMLHDGRAAGAHQLGRDEDGVFDRIIDGAAAGDRYSYRLDGGDPRPDPASRYQPDGVHGPSLVVDPAAFEWADHSWRGRTPRDLAVYELHVGTFTREGTFRGVTACLHHLRDLGITAIELMPLADFAGERNWGYDGVCLWAPARAYGQPDDLRRLVDEAHRLGLSVLLDVVYNHVGPEGAYLPQFSPEYLTDTHLTPWGQAVNLDAPGSAMVRRFIVENALHWIREYHVDGLRLDATHALVDDSGTPLVQELARAAHKAVDTRPVMVHAEDHRNLAPMVQDESAGGWGLDAVWADDFHHVVRRLLAGDAHSYYSDFRGTTDELARIIRQGWLYTGQHAPNFGACRGTDPSGVPMRRFVVCLQNHDQVGNRALGDRLNHQVNPDVWRAASTLLLTSPMTPLLFQGQEWAASTPFLYFTDLEPGTGRLVSEGRRKEFKDFPEFASPEAREGIPDPQARSTFEASRLHWRERDEPAHARVLALYRTLLSLRLEHQALGASDDTSGEAWAPGEDTIVMRRASDSGNDFWVAVQLRGDGLIDMAAVCEAAGVSPCPSEWDPVLTTEDPMFAIDPSPVVIDRQPGGPLVRFSRPGAVVFRTR